MFLQAINWLFQCALLVYLVIMLTAAVVLWTFPHMYTSSDSNFYFRLVHRLTNPIFVSLQRFGSKLYYNELDLRPLVLILGIVVVALVLLPFLLTWSPIAVLPIETQL